MHFAADGGCWCLSARTLLIRAAILQDQNFADAYTHELIGRRVVNTADDVFLTEWVFERGWKVSIQNVLEAEVTTNIPRDHRFVWQVLRWDRGNFRSFLGFIFAYPGLRIMMRWVMLRLSQGLRRRVTWFSLLTHSMPIEDTHTRLGRWSSALLDRPGPLHPSGFGSKRSGRHLGSREYSIDCISFHMFAVWYFS